MTGTDDISPGSDESTNIVVVSLNFHFGLQPVRYFASGWAPFTLPDEVCALLNCLLESLNGMPRRDFSGVIHGRVLSTLLIAKERLPNASICYMEASEVLPALIQINRPDPHVPDRRG